MRQYRHSTLHSCMLPGRSPILTIRSRLRVLSGKEYLQASQIGVSFYARRYHRGCLKKDDHPRNTKSVKNKRKQLNSCKIHHRAEILLHNRDNLINFVAVPMSCRNFHWKSDQTFLKVTNFKGLLQAISNLKTNNITDKIHFLSSTK